MATHVVSELLSSPFVDLRLEDTIHLIGHLPISCTRFCSIPDVILFLLYLIVCNGGPFYFMLQDVDCGYTSLMLLKDMFNNAQQDHNLAPTRVALGASTNMVFRRRIYKRWQTSGGTVFPLECTITLLR